MAVGEGPNFENFPANFTIFMTPDWLSYTLKFICKAAYAKRENMFPGEQGLSFKSRPQMTQEEVTILTYLSPVQLYLFLLIHRTTVQTSCMFRDSYDNHYVNKSME